MATDRKTKQTIITEAQAKAKAAYDANKEARVEAREQRKVDRAKRTPQQQLALLNTRLGLGVGAEKERAKLEAKILIDEQQKTSEI